MDGNKLITDQKATKEGEKDVRAVSYFSHYSVRLMAYMTYCTF
jgi:hypothetical protein